MAHFPVFIDIKDKKCLVVGGGRVAARKISTLLRYGACVHVISPDVCREITDMLPAADNTANPEKRIRILKSSFADLGQERLDRELSGACLVVAASADREANHLVHLLCKDRQIPVNVVDEPKECSFLFPAVVKKGPVSIGINTGGDSPIVSRRIREEAEKLIPDYYGDIALQLGDLRRRLKDRFPEEAVRRRILKEAAQEAFCNQRVLSEEEIRGIIESS
ncbi:MAG: bifunctional precorrin-2 dehydrogenase/sirohydrochlorin ferrochelatase [Eubacterium sp.]|nr:bifunctional precorrin-2 dehydrogenase/sirohydrochlorin ferrochelatase [Eubacterium sp.]